MQQIFIIEYASFLLQDATVVTKCDVYYKLRQFTPFTFIIWYIFYAFWIEKLVYVNFFQFLS